MSGLQVAANVGISIGEIETLVNGAVDQLRPQSDPRPFYLTRAATAIGNGTGPAVLNLFGPPSGSLWQIRFITTFGSDAYTTVTDSADPGVPVLGALYAGDPETSPSLAQLLLLGFQFPSTTYVPDTTMWCHPNQSLFITTGGAQVQSGQQVGCVAGIEEWRESDVSRNSGR